MYFTEDCPYTVCQLAECMRSNALSTDRLNILCRFHLRRRGFPGLTNTSSLAKHTFQQLLSMLSIIQYMYIRDGVCLCPIKCQ